MSRIVKKNDRTLCGRQIRLIDADNNQIGIVSLEEAIKRAEENSLDLVLVADQVDPPVCRVMNYGRFTYEKNRKEREQRRKQAKASGKTKEIKFHANIDPHDYQIKADRIGSFLKKGYKVKISLVLRGREMKNRDKGLGLMNRIIKDLQDISHVDMHPKFVGRNIYMLLSPSSHKS